MVYAGGKISPKRGEIYLVNFDPSIGSEIKKVRPALVIQNNIANEYSPIVIVAAITSKFDDKLYPSEVLVDSKMSGLDHDSVVQLNQIRSIDKQRLVRGIGFVDDITMSHVNQSLLISLELIEI